jgi:hypothetical protein
VWTVSNLFCQKGFAKQIVELEASRPGCVIPRTTLENRSVAAFAVDGVRCNELSCGTVATTNKKN